MNCQIEMRRKQYSVVFFRREGGEGELNLDSVNWSTKFFQLYTKISVEKKKRKQKAKKVSLLKSFYLVLIKLPILRHKLNQLAESIPPLPLHFYLLYFFI